MDELGTTAETTPESEAPRSERRRNPRFACNGPIEVGVFDAEFLFRGEIRDLSLAGCYVRTRARLRLRRGAEVELRFTLAKEQVKCLARVTNVRAGAGAGFQFVDLEEKPRKAIERSIEMLAGAAQTTPAGAPKAG